ncbi:MAG: hypothetical protein AAF990_22300 [Bacteroidota bacterium]
MKQRAFLVKAARLIWYNVLVLFCLVFVCELGFRWFQPNYTYYEQAVTANFHKKAVHQMDTNWLCPDPLLGWVCQSKTPLKFYHPDFEHIQYGINAQGFRNTMNFDTLPEKSDAKRILLLGDSFLFGLFLADHQTISSCLQQRLPPSYEVYNLAIPAWGLDQMQVAYQHYLDSIQPDLSILFYIDDDVSRVVEAFFWGASTKPTFELEADQLRPKPAEAGRLHRITEFFVFQSKMFNAIYKGYCQQKARPIATRLIQQMAASEQQQGRQLLALRCPRIQQLGETYTPPFDLREDIAPFPLSYTDLADTIRRLEAAEREALYIPEDGHLSVAGAEFICELLYKQIRTAVE